jgi:serine/threonine protein kinase
MSEYAVGDEPVPGYQITRPLGAGGYGTVWVAVSPGDVEIALKIINLQGQGLKEFRAIGLVKKLRHPNLIPIYAYWLKDEYGNFLDSAAQDSINLRGRRSELLIAMGLGDKSLAQRLDECMQEFAKRHGLPNADAAVATKVQEMGGADLAGIPFDELIEYMFGAARAIDYLNQPTHNIGTGTQSAIQHCDIKPGNLLIVSNDVQVCDYGLARVTGDARKTIAAGTPAYMAPELFANKPTNGTDQYSLAISYYELRTGKLPFEESVALHAHITGQLDLSLLSPAEQTILRRATHLQSDQRFTHTIEMVRALREAVTPSRVHTPLSAPISTPVVMPAGSTPSAPPVSTPSAQPASTPSVPPPPPSGAAAVAATPTIASKPIVLDDLIRAGNELVPGHWLVRLLGRGGYGEVWEARMAGHTKCAVKIVRNLDAVQGKQEFKSLDLIRDLDHDRLIRLQAYWLLGYDGTVIPDDQIGQPGAPKACGLVVATDLAAKNLQDRWNECHEQGLAGIEVRELVRYARQAAEAIDYLNFQEESRSIVHRDIKPENILLTKDGRVKVSDFGLAKVVEGASTQINSASVGMTLAYAAPELFRNQVTRFTDQYSLAVTYYRLRTGKLPFDDGLGPIQMMQAHATGSLDFGGVGDAEAAVLKRACAVEPTNRYASCLEFVDALSTALGFSRPGVSMPAIPSTPSMTPVPGAWPADAAAAARAATASFPAATAQAGSGPNVRETLRFEDVRSTPTPAVAQGQRQSPRAAPPAQPSSGEFSLPAEPKRASSLPAGLMMTTTEVPSAADTAPTPSKTDSGWKATQAGGGGGGKAVAIAAAAAVLIAAVGGGVYWLVTHKGEGGTSVASNPSTRTSSSQSGTEPSNRSPSEAERVAKIETDAAQDVGNLVGKNDFERAFKRVNDARTAGAGQTWATERAQAVVAEWKKFAAAKPALEERRDEYQRIKTAYPEDPELGTLIAGVEKEMSNQAIAAMNEKGAKEFAAAVTAFRAHNFKAAAASLNAVEGMKPSDGLGKQIKDLRDAMADLDRKANDPADEKLVIGLAKQGGRGKPGEQQYQAAVRHAYRRLLAEKIEQFVPKVGDQTKDWQELFTASNIAVPTDQAEPVNPWVAAFRAECVTELIRNRQFAGAPSERTLPAAPAAGDAALTAYDRYVTAARGWVDANTDEEKETAAGRLAALAPAATESPAGRLNEYRCGKVLADLRAAVEMDRGTNRLAPFAAPKAAAVATWLAAADRLADRLDASAAKLPSEDRERLRLDMAVALLAQQPPADAQARPVTDKLVADSTWVESLAVPDAVLLWVSHARSRDLANGGRPEAVRALTQVMTLLRDNLPADVPADFVHSAVVKRLAPADNNPQDVIGASPDAALKPAAARLCALTARNLDRHAKTWDDAADLGPEDGRDKARRELVLELLKRAAALDPTDENRASVGIALIGAGDAKGVAQFLPAGGTAATGGTVPAVFLLRGLALVQEGDSKPAQGDRVAKWKAADAAFRDGLKKFPGPTDPGERWNEMMLLYENAADNCIKLANNVSPEQAAGYLTAADQDAKNLLAVDRTCVAAHDIRGCALEDVAWILKGDDMFAKYGEAVNAFTAGLGGFGARAKARMHRGRCHVKWAADLINSGKGKPGEASGLLDNAAADLRAALLNDRESAVAAEANFWQARVAGVRWQLAPIAGKRALYTEAGRSFNAAAELAKKLNAPAWRAAAMEFWALAAFDEAKRVAPDKNAAATAAFREAEARAKAVRDEGISRPWAALMLMDLYADVQSRLDGQVHVQKAMDAGRDGLKGDQDKGIQFQILIRLAEYQTSILDDFSEKRNGSGAIADAKAALAMATNEKFGPEAEAEAHGASGLGYYFNYLGFGATGNQPADLQSATKELGRAVELAPHHRKSWKWKVYLAGFRMPGQEVKPATAATRYAEAYRLFREAESSLDQTGEAGVYQKTVIIPGRADALRRGTPVWDGQITNAGEKNNPDRPMWLLAAAEALAVQKRDSATAQNYIAEARKGLSKLPEDQQKALQDQITRTEGLLKAAGASK